MVDLVGQCPIYSAAYSPCMNSSSADFRAPVSPSTGGSFISPAQAGGNPAPVLKGTHNEFRQGERRGGCYFTHDELVEAASMWLQKTCAVVVTELATSGEEPDAIGWQGTHSTLVECKATRSDFLADRRKGFRIHPDSGIGAHRYYLTPKGLVDPQELPPRWGLLELHEGRVRSVLKSEYFSETNCRHELGILLSCIRRLGVRKEGGCSIRCYTIETRNRATLCMEGDV